MAVLSAVISSRSNARVKQLRAAFSDKRRLSEGLVGIEGEHLLDEAMRSGIVPKTLFLSSRREIPPAIAPATEIVRLSDDVFASAVETRSPQGIAALVEPRVHTIEDVIGSGPSLIIVAAGLQDPGNLGTLIRSAEAFGATGILTTPGTVSQWNQKALRASVGSVFRLPVASATHHEITTLSRRGLSFFAAVGSRDSGVISAQDTDLRKACAIIIGNEGAGLSDVWISLATAKITIPCPGPVESLNAAVAGSLLLYEASRQRISAVHQRSAAIARIPNTQPRRPTGAAR